MSGANIGLLQEMEPAQIFALTGDVKVQQVVGRLKFISKIKQGEKVNVRELFVRDNDSVWQRFIRSLRNYSTYLAGSDIVESKEATLNFIKDSVNDSINLIAIYRRGKEKFQQQIANIIVENLENAKGGIRNSIATYQYDRKFISHAEAVMQTLEARIVSLKENGLMQGMSDLPLMPDIKTTGDENQDMQKINESVDL